MMSWTRLAPPPLKIRKYRRVEYRCKLCPKSFGDPEAPNLLSDLAALVKRDKFEVWLSGIAVHVTVNHPERTGTLPFNELVIANYS